MFGYVKTNRMSWNGNGMSYPVPMEAKAARIKHFALILMSWEYEFSGNVEFVFSEE